MKTRNMLLILFCLSFFQYDTKSQNSVFIDGIQDSMINLTFGEVFKSAYVWLKKTNGDLGLSLQGGVDQIFAPEISFNGHSLADLVENENGQFQDHVQFYNQAKDDRFNIGVFDQYYNIVFNEEEIEGSNSTIGIRYNSSLIATISNTGVYKQISDERLKRNLEDLHPTLDKVMKIKPKRYQFKDQAKINIGFSAQNLQKLFPELIEVSKSNASENYLVDYNGMIPVLVKAIQEQQRQIESLNNEIASLKSNIKN